MVYATGSHMSRDTDFAQRLNVRQIAPDEWIYDVEVAADIKFPVERFKERVRGSRAAAVNAALDLHDARKWQRLSERQAAKGTEVGSRKKQATEADWAVRTRALRNDGKSLMEAAQAAAGETGYKLQSSYRGVSNQLRRAERRAEAAVSSNDPNMKSRRARESMERLKHLRDRLLST
jgi:hypothetical protein